MINKDQESSTENVQPAEVTNNETQVRFTEFDLPTSLLKAYEDLGFEFCTPIQSQSLKVTMEGHDVTGKAQNWYG